MAAKIWDGTRGSFRASQHWSPSGRPAAGDELYIQSGAVTIKHEIFGSANTQTIIGLIGSTADDAPLLVLKNITLDNVLIDERPLFETPRSTFEPNYGTIRIAGTVTNNGGIFEAGQNDRTPGSSLNIAIDDDATLINKGVLESYAYNRLIISGGTNSTLENDGTISAFGGPIKISANLTGVGETDIVGAGVGLSSSVEIDAAVDAGQTFRINRGPLQLDQPLSFLGQVDINQQDVGGLVRLESLDAASWDFKSNLLELFDNSGSRIGTLQFITPRDPATLSIYVTPDAGFGQTVNVANSRPFDVPSDGALLPYNHTAA